MFPDKHHPVCSRASHASLILLLIEEKSSLELRCGNLGRFCGERRSCDCCHALNSDLFLSSLGSDPRKGPRNGGLMQIPQPQMRSDQQLASGALTQELRPLKTEWRDGNERPEGEVLIQVDETVRLRAMRRL